MAFTDPQSVTISGSAVSLPRVDSGNNKSTYTSADGLVSLVPSSIYGRRTRRAIKINHAKIAPDPLISSTNVKYSMSSTLVVDTPLTGYTQAEAKAVVDGFLAYLQASSGAIVLRLLGGEN